MIASSNLSEITFYVENYHNRPGTVNCDIGLDFLPSKRRSTPIVKCRNIRQKFLRYH